VNLLQNAVRHGPVGNRIALSLCRDGTGASISVTESAPDIPPEDRDKVPTAFYWCDDVHATEGNGPGLALVKSTADRHEARLTLSENLPGLRVTIRFPQTLNI
jgi:signal transduction histidine kinase